MATAVLKSLTLPCHRPGFTAASSPTGAAAPVSAAFGRRGTPVLPESRGLRIARRPPSAASAAGSASRGFVCRRAVVCEAQDTTTEIPDVSKTTWQSLVIENDSPVLVEFSAPWCGPCRMIHPIVVKLSKTYEGKLKCFKLNTDESPDIATQYGIRSIPTVMIFKNGEKKDAVIGAVPESTLVTSIEKFLAK